MLNNDLRQTREYATFMQKLGWLIYEVPIPNSEESNRIFIWRISKTPFSFIRAYKIRGPIPFQILERLEKKYRAISTRIEPFLLSSHLNKGYEKLFYQHKYHKDTWCHFPSITIKIDLTKRLDLIMKTMHKNTRYNIGLSQRRKVKILTYTGTSLLSQKNIFYLYYKLLDSNTKRLKITSYPYKWLNTLASIFKDNFILCLAFLNNKLIAGSLFIANGDGLYYIQNCSTKIGRKNRAPSLLIFRAIQEGKKKSLTFLDLEGIYDKRYADENKSWKGFTNFKLGFRGDIEEYVGSYIKTNFDSLNKISQFQTKLFVPRYLPSLYPEDSFYFTSFELKLRKLFSIRDLENI